MHTCSIWMGNSIHSITIFEYTLIYRLSNLVYRFLSPSQLQYFFSNRFNDLTYIKRNLVRDEDPQKYSWCKAVLQMPRFESWYSRLIFFSIFSGHPLTIIRDDCKHVWYRQRHYFDSIINSRYECFDFITNNLNIWKKHDIEKFGYHLNMKRKFLS